MYIFAPPSNFSKVSRILLFLFTLLIFQTSFALAQDAPFITVWQTDNPGTSENNQITIPGTGTDYLIEWEEVGNEANNNGSETGTDSHTVTFPSAGTYRVMISGGFSGIKFQGSGDSRKIIEISSWGDIEWKDLQAAFLSCSNLEYTASDAPNLTEVTDLSYMFSSTKSFNGNLNNWNVSNITNMSHMFSYSNSFNGNISSWDVSNVNDMSSMFLVTAEFNSEIGSWDVSNVANMSEMFSWTEKFNSDISEWDVSNVTDMREMFLLAESFNGDISKWHVAKVQDMEGMFASTKVFNSVIGEWNVSSVSTMESMFYNARSFNQDLINWSVNSVENMRLMFHGASDFNGAIQNWDVSNVQNMMGMFAYAYDFNQNIEAWDVSTATDMSDMFQDALNFEGQLTDWDVSNVQSMYNMFRNAKKFNGEIEKWDVSNVNNMYNMFRDAESFNQNLESWNISNVLSLSGIFENTSLSTFNYDNILIGWSQLSGLQSEIYFRAAGMKYCASSEARDYLKNEKGWDINYDVKGCEEAYISIWDPTIGNTGSNMEITIPFFGSDYLIYWEAEQNFLSNGYVRAKDVHVLDLPESRNYKIMILSDSDSLNINPSSDSLKLIEIENWGAIKWSNFSSAFAGAENLIITADDAPDLSQVTDMSRMFYNAKSLNQDISHWDVSNVTDMSDLFHGASSFNQDLSNWDVSNVTKMTRMFANTDSFNQDLNSWNTENVEEMDFMFWDADAFEGNISDWNTSNVTNMWGMFYGADSMNTDISNWDVSGVTNMTEMFRETSSFNQDLSSWNVSNVTEMSGMFYEATAFDQNLGDWDMSNVNSLFEFLTNSGLSLANYDLSLETWATNGNIPSNIALSAEGLFYCASAEYRLQLIDDFGWNIMGDETCSLAMQETMPAAKATSVVKDTEIYLTFDQEIQEIDLSGIALKDVSGNAISLTDIYIDSLTLHLVHNGLGSNTYEVVIPESSIISITGKENDSIRWSFATQRILSSKDEQKTIDHSTFPNPFSDFTTIQFNLPQTQSVNLLVFDQKGQIVRKEQYDNLGSDKQSIKFERKDLPTGLYRYQLQSAGGTVVGKMLIN